jgi:hypothetical protein
MYSENKKKLLIFFFNSFFLLAHEGFHPKAPEVWTTPDFFLRPPFSFWPTSRKSSEAPQTPQPQF